MDPDTGRTCGRCKRLPLADSLYLLRFDGEEVVCCIRCALRNWPVMKRSVFIALVVGTMLIVLNQGDVVAGGELPPALWWKIPLTYLTPFLVSLWGALGSAKR